MNSGLARARVPYILVACPGVLQRSGKKGERLKERLGKRLLPALVCSLACLLFHANLLQTDLLSFLLQLPFRVALSLLPFKVELSLVNLPVFFGYSMMWLPSDSRSSSPWRIFTSHIFF